MKQTLFSPSGSARSGRNSLIRLESLAPRRGIVIPLVLEGCFEPKMFRLLRQGLVPLVSRAPALSQVEGAYGLDPVRLGLRFPGAPSWKGGRAGFPSLFAVVSIEETAATPTPRFRPGKEQPVGPWTVADFIIQIAQVQGDWGQEEDPSS